MPNHKTIPHQPVTETTALLPKKKTTKLKKKRSRLFSVGSEVYCRGEGIGKIEEVHSPTSTAVVSFDDGTKSSVNETLLTPLSRAKRQKREGIPKLHFVQTAAHDSTLRTITSNGAVFNLVSTIVGGGVLSLPYAFAKCGLVLGTLALFLSSITSSFSIDLLVASSRGVGRSSYASVVQKAFGTNAQAVTGALIMTLTWLCAVAYIVLVGDLLVPIFDFFYNVDAWGRRIICALAILGVAPMCYQRSLSSLSALSVLSVVSIIIVAGAICYHSLADFDKTHVIYSSQRNVPESFAIKPHIRYFPTSWFDALNVFPVFGVCFLCHFNVLPIHTELQAPTRSHMRLVVKYTMGLCTSLYFVTGVLGYFWSYSQTCGNILLNFSPDDILISIGRVCLSLTLLFSFPLLVLPCRNAMHNLITVIASKRRPRRRSRIRDGGGKSHLPQSETRIYVYHESPQNEMIEFDSFIMKDKQSVQEQPLSTGRLFALTTLILLSTLATGCFLSSVLIVWTIMGATVSFMIAYILPSMIYLKLRSTQGGPYYILGAKFLFGFSVIAAIACTITIVYNLEQTPCPAVDKTRFINDVFF